MLTVQKKIFSLAGMSPKSSNMTAKSGINTADTSKVYHFLVVGADALTMSEITVDGVSVEKVGGCAREFLVVDGFLCSRSDSTKTFVHTRDVNEMSAMYCASGASNSEFSESIKKSLPLCGNTVYGYKAPHKTGAGFRSPEMYEATHDAPSVFFCAVSQTHTFFSDAVIPRRLQNYGGLDRAAERLAGFLVRRYCELCSVHHQRVSQLRWWEELPVQGGCHMLATTPTQKPQFIWIIAAVRRDCPTITAKIHHIAAESERDARRSLVRDHICFFAGRIRMEVAHD